MPPTPQFQEILDAKKVAVESTEMKGDSFILKAHNAEDKKSLRVEIKNPISSAEKFKWDGAYVKTFLVKKVDKFYRTITHRCSSITIVNAKGEEMVISEGEVSHG